MYPATVADWRVLAQRRLPRFLFDYVEGGAGDEATLAANVADFAAIRLRQRVLLDVAQVDTRSQLAGQACAPPLAAGVPFTLSTVGICPLAEVVAATGQAPWFQLYMLRDRGAVRALLEAAWAGGCRTLVFTVDLPLPGMRWRDVRNGMAASSARAALLRARQVLARPGWVSDVVIGGRPLSFGNLHRQVPGGRDLNTFKAWIDAQFDPGVSWRDIDWLRDQWQGRLLLKGILEVDDARAAVASGADGIVVSNHGGRQLDAAPASITALPAIARAVGSRTEVLMDGGVRSGVDIFKALALGARGVLIGRPWVWALAAQGQAGVTRLLAHWQRELLLTMTLAGVSRIADINPSHLITPPERP